MNIDFTGEEVATIKESMQYSKKAISEAKGTPYEVRQENLARCEAVLDAIRRAEKPQSPPAEAP